MSTDRTGHGPSELREEEEGDERAWLARAWPVDEPPSGFADRVLERARLAGAGGEEASRDDAPRDDAPRNDGPRNDGPRNDGPRNDGPRNDGPRDDAPREDGPREDVRLEDARLEDAGSGARAARSSGSEASLSRATGSDTEPSRASSSSEARSEVGVSRGAADRLESAAGLAEEAGPAPAPRRVRPSSTTWLWAAAGMLAAGVVGVGVLHDRARDVGDLGERKGVVPTSSSDPSTLRARPSDQRATTLEGPREGRDGPSPGPRATTDATGLVDGRAEAPLDGQPAEPALTATAVASSAPIDPFGGDGTITLLEPPAGSASASAGEQAAIPPRGRPPARCDPRDPLCDDGSSGVRGAAPPPSGQLGTGDIEAVLAQGRGEVRRRCWETLERKPGAHARVSVRMTILQTGRVATATADGDPAFPPLGPCVLSVVRGFTFPASDSSSSVSFPISFRDAD